jgi:hypothetical protein
LEGLPCCARRCAKAADAAGSYALAKEEEASDLDLLANSVLRDIQLQV